MVYKNIDKLQIAFYTDNTKYDIILNRGPPYKFCFPQQRGRHRFFFFSHHHRQKEEPLP